MREALYEMGCGTVVAHPISYLHSRDVQFKECNLNKAV